MLWCLVFLLSAISSYAAALSRPSWLRPCSRKDVNFNECAIESAKYGIPLLLNGDKKLGLPSFNPFKISQVELFGQENFNLKLNDLEVYGLDQVQPKNVSVDFNKRKVSVVTYVPKIDILANYEIDGRILFLPLKGTGPCKLSLVDGTYQYNFTFDLEARNGVDYAKIKDELSTYDYDIKNGVFDLKNLFNGDKLLGDETNKLLNESWQDLNKELKGSIIQTLLSVYGQLANKIYEHVPFNELVLP